MTYEPKHLKRWTMPSNYFGPVWPNYYSSGFGRSRDSDCLEESNFETAKAALLALSTGDMADTVEVVREHHWAVGWVEWIAIHQDNARALIAADALRARYKQYPVLDADDYSDREQEEANRVWKDCYSVKERIAYIRENPNQFDSVRGLADLMGCVRGNYFAGYAGELIS
jgi:hypothetical protein